MFTVSLHGIRLHAKVGLYPEEKINGNDFEIDVDIKLDLSSLNQGFPFIDYTIIYEIVSKAFQQPGDLLETYVQKIHQDIKERVNQPGIVKVAIKKLTPPIDGDIAYAQVSFEA